MIEEGIEAAMIAIDIGTTIVDSIQKDIEREYPDVKYVKSLIEGYRETLSKSMVEQIEYAERDNYNKEFQEDYIKRAEEGLKQLNYVCDEWLEPFLTDLICGNKIKINPKTI